MGILSTNGSNEQLLINCSLQNVTDPLKTLVSLQDVFKTDVFKGYESWRFTINDHNLLCISTNTKGKYQLVIKNGRIVFYDSSTRMIKNDLSGETIPEVLENLGTALKLCSFCRITTNEKDNGSEKIFEFKIKEGENGGVLRTSVHVENFN